MGGWPGEVEEEGRAAEGKQGMEEVTCTVRSSNCHILIKVSISMKIITIMVNISMIIITIMVSISMMTTCSIEAGKPGRPIDDCDDG